MMSGTASGSTMMMSSPFPIAAASWLIQVM
jgi:hypothetical protein